MKALLKRKKRKKMERDFKRDKIHCSANQVFNYELSISLSPKTLVLYLNQLLQRIHLTATQQQTRSFALLVMTTKIYLHQRTKLDQKIKVNQIMTVDQMVKKQHKNHHNDGYYFP